MFKTVIFDIDSTLVTIEGLLEIARYKGFNHELEKITRLGNEGKISFSESLDQRLQVIRPSIEDLQWLSEYYVEHVTDGAKEVVKHLAGVGIEIYLISGSFVPALARLQSTLEINEQHCFANSIVFDEKGEYAGIDLEQPLANNGGKLEILKRISPKREIAFVGDGSTDLETKEYVNLFIGFGGVVEREIVKQQADHFITDLRDVIELVESKDV